MTYRQFKPLFAILIHILCLYLFLEREMLWLEGRWRPSLSLFLSLPLPHSLSLSLSLYIYISLSFSLSLSLPLIFYEHTYLIWYILQFNKVRVIRMNFFAKLYVESSRCSIYFGEKNLIFLCSNVNIVLLYQGRFISRSFRWWFRVHSSS